MKDFHSRTLDRSFDEILFVMSLYVTEKAPTNAEAMIEQAHKAAATTAIAAPEPGEIPASKGG